jgi:hypothetical protein
LKTIRVLALLALASASAFPQTTAQINGAVSDSSGGRIAGAEVSVTNTATGARRETETAAEGHFSVPLLPSGSYRVTVRKDGFKPLTRQGITLTTGQSLELNITLDVGAVTEAISVAATASILETRNSDVGQFVEAKTIENMPLGDRRSMNIINIMGGAVFVNYAAGAKPNFSLAGGRTQSQMFWIDGGSGQNMRLGVGQMDMDPPVEAVQEVKVLSNNYSAEYGGSAGGVVVTTTKSGTNSFRGTLFEYLRNEKLDSANFFSPISGTEKIKAPLRYNVFGGTIGGPIRRDKLFFFFAYEGSRRSEGATRTLTVPSVLQRSGDFSETRNAAGALIPMYDPSTTRLEGTRNVRTQFPGNRIPAARLDPVALKLMEFFPSPNRTPDNLSGANNFRANGGTGLSRNNYTAKVDYHLDTSNHFLVRYLYNSDVRTGRSVYPVDAAETVNDQPAHQQYIFGSWTRVLSPSIVNDARFNYGIRFADARSKGLDGNWPDVIGLRGVPQDAFPTFSPAGFAGLGAGTHRRLSTPITNVQLVDNFSWSRGSHTLKFGGDVRRSHITDQLRQSVSGNFAFSPLPTGQPGVGASGNGLASMLLGFPTAFSTRDTPALRRFSWYLSGFAQDDWQVTKTLTLNLGVRWEVDTPIYDADDRMNGFDPLQINPVSGTPGVIKFAGLDGWRSRPYDTDWNNFGPRFGFAWRAFGSERTIIRGGYGIFFAHPFDHGAPTSASLGYEISAALNTPDNGITAPFYLRDGVPVSASALQLNDSFGAVRVGQNPTTAVTFFETNRRAGYSQQYNLSVQRELQAGMVVEVSYLANTARKLSGTNLSINQIPPSRLGPGAAQRDRPYPQFSNVSVVFPSLGVSSYHGGVARFEKRFSRGFNVLSTYTFSKFLNNVDEGGAVLGAEGGPYSNYYNRRADWGPSENDVRHRFTLSGVWELPFGKGRKWFSDGPVRHVVGDWSMGSVVTLQSGAPFTVRTQSNTTNAFSAGALRANVLRDPNLPSGDRSVTRWFDTTAFAQPAIYQFGNQGINLLRADGRAIVNLSILRDFRIRETMRFQFRGEFLNAANHPDFNVPGAVLGAPGFGVVNSATPGRQVQLGLRLIY